MVTVVFPVLEPGGGRQYGQEKLQMKGAAFAPPCMANRKPLLISMTS